MAPGVQPFTFFTLGKETSAGTSVATTREFYPDGTGQFELDTMLSLYRGNRGTRAQLVGGIEKGLLARAMYRSNPDIGLAYDELPIIFSQLDGGNTGAGGSADKTWTIAPSMTGANSQETYTVEVGDDVQAWEMEYGYLPEFTISWSQDSMTQLEAPWHGRQWTKVTATSVAANTAVRIPGHLWEVRFATAQSGLSGASDQANLLLDASIRHQTGLVPRFYSDGLKYFGQTVEAQEQKAEITMHVESTSTAVSQFYDKWRAQTVDFVQFLATGPSLGGSTYSAQLQYAVLYTDVKPISSEQDGVNIYEVSAETVYDSTWATYFGASVVCSISALP